MEFHHEPTIAESPSSIEDEKTLARALGTENSQTEEDSGDEDARARLSARYIFFCPFSFDSQRGPIYRSEGLSRKRVPKRPICPNRVSQIIALPTRNSRGSCATCPPLKPRPFDQGIRCG